jgi:two-component system, OmpR family, sensor histidine kinase QseC
MRLPASLHLRLLGGTLILVGIFWLTLSIMAWQSALFEAEKLFDDELAETASLLAGLAGHEAHELEADLPKPPYVSGVAFQIWDNGTRLALRSETAPTTRLSSVDKGFSDQGDWRVYSLWDEKEKNLIQVAESRQSRLGVSRILAKHLMTPIAIALPLLAIALVLLIRSCLAPLSHLADSIGSRSPERLEHIPIEEAPSELIPILDKLNLLLSRVGDSLWRERRFTADAAHELRTPLAAMRAHAQVARASQASSERDIALDSVLAAIDRTSHLINQLLTLARVDAENLAGHFSTCDLHSQAADILALEANTALGKSVSLELTEGPPVAVLFEPTLLAVLLRNLVDNAVRYSPAGGRVKVRVDVLPTGEAQIEVIDEGPGIPPEKRERVLDRFYRLPGSVAPGAGLGLAIVARIVELAAGKLELADNPDGMGLCVRVKLDLPGQLDGDAGSYRIPRTGHATDDG